MPRRRSVTARVVEPVVANWVGVPVGEVAEAGRGVREEM